MFRLIVREIFHIIEFIFEPINTCKGPIESCNYNVASTKCHFDSQCPSLQVTATWVVTNWFFFLYTNQTCFAQVYKWLLHELVLCYFSTNIFPLVPNAFVNLPKLCTYCFKPWPLLLKTYGILYMNMICVDLN